MTTQIRFEPSGVDGLVASGTTLTAAAERLGVSIETQCGGEGRCTTCAIRAVDEPFSLSPLTDAERTMLSESDLAGGLRLGCQARTGDADCTIHVLDVADRPAMPEAESGHGDSSKSGESKEAAGAAGSGNWFGFDTWSWASSWGNRSGECASQGSTVSDAGTDEAPRDPSEFDDVRRRILEAFSELPAGERLATALELNMKAATDFFGAMFDGPLKAGEQAFDSLMKQAASVVREAKQRDAETSAPPDPPVSPDAPTDHQETDRP